LIDLSSASVKWDFPYRHAAGAQASGFDAQMNLFRSPPFPFPSGLSSKDCNPIFLMHQRSVVVKKLGLFLV